MRTYITNGLLLISGLTLTACGFAVAPASDDYMSITRDEAAFSGTAGAGWSDQDIRDNRRDVLCADGQTIEGLKITRQPDGSATFSGRCGD